MILSSWHHPYYRELFEAEGLVKAMDLLMWSLHICDRVARARRDLADGRQRRGRARDRLPADAKARSRRRGEALPRGLQRRLGAQLGGRAADRGGGSPLRQGAQADPRRELGVHRRARDTGEVGRGGADAAGLQPGARATSTAACCRSAGPRRCTGGARSMRCASSRSASSPSTSTPACRRALLPAALRCGRAHAAEGRRDGLDPRDQPADEPRDGGHGRRDRAPLPRLRAHAWTDLQTDSG